MNRDNPVFVGGGEMGAVMRSTDWAKTPFGPAAQWPSSLRAATALCLATPFAMAVWWGQDLRLLYNDAYATILGPLRHPGALGQPYRTVWAEIWPYVEEMFDAVMQRGDAVHREDEHFFVGRAGFQEEAFFTYSLSPIRLDDGSVGGALNVVVETTARMVAARRLRTLQDVTAAASEARTSGQAAQAIAEALGRHGADIAFVLLYLIENPETMQLAGLARIAPDHPAAIPHLAHTADHPWPFAAALQGGGAVEVGLDNDGPFPGGAWPEPARGAVVLPLYRPGRGEVIGALVLGASPRLRLDGEYRAFLVGLGDQVSTALAEALALEKMESARKEAETANRAKSEFLASMSHELRTPLNAIGGYVDLLDFGVHGKLTTEQHDALARIRVNQDHLLMLINDVLSFAKLEAGQVQVESVALNACTIIADLEPLVFPLANDRGIRYADKECPPDLWLRGDRERVMQILLNLITNGIKFTPRGGCVEVGCAACDDFVVIDVSDDGPGIPADRHEAIFDPFVQIERRLHRPQEGTGLGLAISRDLARAMAGDIRVESEPGQGSRFTLILPAADPPASGRNGS